MRYNFKTSSTAAAFLLGATISMFSVLAVPAHADSILGSSTIGNVVNSVASQTPVTINANVQVPDTGGQMPVINSPVTTLGVNVKANVPRVVNATINAKIGSSPHARSKAIAAVNVRLGALNQKQLLRLCLSIGGSGSCGGKSAVQLRAIIRTNLDVAPVKVIANVCIAVGTSCGAPSIRGNNPPVPQTGGNPTIRRVTDDSSRMEREGMPKICRAILRGDLNYGPEFRQLCRKLQLR
jgi:hypothetical protein